MVSDVELKSGCKVPRCSNGAYMGWRPLTERVGRLICNGHWNSHKEKSDDFNLFDAFGFKRLSEISERPASAELSRSVPRALPAPKSVKIIESGCRDCGKPKESGHSDCRDCSNSRKALAHRDRQKRYRQRQS